MFESYLQAIWNAESVRLHQWLFALLGSSEEVVFMVNSSVVAMKHQYDWVLQNIHLMFPLDLTKRKPDWTSSTATKVTAHFLTAAAKFQEMNLWEEMSSCP